MQTTLHSKSLDDLPHDLDTQPTRERGELEGFEGRWPSPFFHPGVFTAEFIAYAKAYGVLSLSMDDICSQSALDPAFGRDSPFPVSDEKDVQPVTAYGPMRNGRAIRDFLRLLAAVQRAEI